MTDIEEDIAIRIFTVRHFIECYAKMHSIIKDKLGTPLFFSNEDRGKEKYTHPFIHYEGDFSYHYERAIVEFGGIGFFLVGSKEVDFEVPEL